MGVFGLLGVPDAASELQAVWGDRRDGAMGRRQEPTDDDQSLVLSSGFAHSGDEPRAARPVFLPPAGRS